MPYRHTYEELDSEESLFAETRDSVIALRDTKEHELEAAGNLIVNKEDFAYPDTDGTIKYCGKIYYRKQTIK